MPLVIADPRFIPPITHLQDKHPIEDYVTTVSAYLYASADHRAMLLFGEDEIDLLPGAEEILEHGLA